MTGGLAGGARIGVAPDAKWISAKGCEGATCSESALLAAAQWMLAPTDLAGNNPRPELRPDIINNSWGSDNGIAVEDWYQDSVQAWIAAGMFPVSSNGNSGPACNTEGSPGDYTTSYALGAFDSKGVIASFSSRGQGENGVIKPDIAAPGVNIRSAYPGNSYANMSGTSMAAPHTAGAVALLWSAAPALAGDITATRELLDSTAVDVDDTSCGGTADDNNVWGEGKLARRSDRDGKAALWLPVDGQSDWITVIASKDGLSSATDVATVKRSGSAHVTLTLRPAGGCPGQ